MLPTTPQTFMNVIKQKWGKKLPAMKYNREVSLALWLQQLCNRYPDTIQRSIEFIQRCPISMGPPEYIIAANWGVELYWESIGIYYKKIEICVESIVEFRPPEIVMRKTVYEDLNEPNIIHFSPDVDTIIKHLTDSGPTYESLFSIKDRE